jgi:hypothetical protein
MDALNIKETMDEDLKKKQDEEHKYEIYKVLSDPKYQQ